MAKTRARTQTFEDFLAGKLGKKAESRLYDSDRALNDMVYTSMQNRGSQALYNNQTFAQGNPTQTDMGQVSKLGSGIISPVAGVTEFSNSFGAARSGGRQHKGIDIMAPTGTPVFSTVPGTVTKGAYESGLGGTSFGYEDDYGNYHYFTHLSSAVSIPQGTRIPAGAMLGRVGQTGNAAGTSPHLHYSINEGRAHNINAYSFLTSGVSALPGYR